MRGLWGESMQFALRQMMIVMVLLAVAFRQLTIAVAKRGDVLALLVGASILAAIAGAGVVTLCRCRRRLRQRVAICSATLAGVGCSFFLIQFEWHKSHPWPAPDEFYGALAAVRGGLLGGLIGALTAMIMGYFAIESRDRTTLSDLVAKELASEAAPPLYSSFACHRLPSLGHVALLLVVGAFCLVVWAPYIPLYRQEAAVVRLLNAIESGDVALVTDRAQAVVRRDATRGSTGRVMFLALNGSSREVRAAALCALQSLGEPALNEPVTRMVLQQIAKDEIDPQIRGTAWALLWSPATPPGTQRQ